VIKRGLIISAVFLFMTMVGLVVLTTRAASEEGCVTGQCHASLLTGKTMHPVAQSCENCHQSVSTPHPQKNKKTFKLIQDVPQLCYMCHSPFGTKPYIHPPVKDGMCTTCHNPHSSDQPKLLAQPLKDLCLSCHPDKGDYKYVHGPVSTGDCTTCHDPHESPNKNLVVKDGNDLCLTCHMDMQEEIKKKDIHPALESGCTSCHSPHGSAFPKFLSAEGPQLCFQCHPDIGETIEKAKGVHAPVKSPKGCVSCHSPHASNNEKLLTASGKDLCLGCHKDIIKKNHTVLHGPIKAGKCTPCHNPHGSIYSKLLIGEFPDDIYVPYTDQEYALCFSCHNRDLVRFPDTSFATGFRDGDRNLHFLHVNKKEKGRSCKACHVFHDSDNPRLIADKVPFGKWEYPLRYIKTDTGGSCAPGCHKKVNYDRKTPGKEPEPVQPKGKEKK
jgi:predicted CXXCH cytochrome family protein